MEKEARRIRPRSYHPRAVGQASTGTPHYLPDTRNAALWPYNIYPERGVAATAGPAQIWQARLPSLRATFSVTCRVWWVHWARPRQSAAVCQATDTLLMHTYTRCMVGRWRAR